MYHSYHRKCLYQWQHHLLRRLQESQVSQRNFFIRSFKTIQNFCLRFLEEGITVERPGSRRSIRVDPGALRDELPTAQTPTEAIVPEIPVARPEEGGGPEGPIEILPGPRIEGEPEPRDAERPEGIIIPITPEDVMRDRGILSIIFKEIF